MTDAIMLQVNEQVKKAMEVANSARPLRHFNYVLTTGCKPSHRHVPVKTQYHSGVEREVACLDKNGRPRGDNHDRFVEADALHNRRPSQGVASEVNHGLNTICNAFSMYCLVRGAGADLEAPRGDLGSITRVEIHQLRIPTLGLGLTTFLYILDMRLEVALLAESVKGQGHQEFTKELCTVLISPPVALMLDFGRLLSPHRGLSLCSGVGFL
ncbi:hypothetical protein Cgig2_030968 [Carnegiea gigantea]|uniref:Uncharacterized protein n=1 Tax=Carnegiea gigantea TaxID=171969 RepID=A0A9Q1JL65_9CARY|nr:hypothetical protein Cgig2_030968 [Carnegiea gigantea]